MVTGAQTWVQHCNSTGAFAPFVDPSGKITGDRGDTYEKKVAVATPAAAAVEKETREQNDRLLSTGRPTGDITGHKPRKGWPWCGMITHGVNTAQAIKSAAVLWRFSGNETLKQLSDQRMASLDEKYGVATGLFCADENLCGQPDAPEADRKSPSRGTELCSVVESMYSYNEMFSILGGVKDADRAERIALNALSATWASPRGGDMWNHQYFQATNQWLAKNVSEHGHLYQDTDGDLESYFSGSDEGGCCTANNGQGWPKYVLRSVYRTPADGGIAIGAFVPLRVQLGADSVLLMDTDYPFEDSVAVLLTNLKQATPLRVRVPSWASRATATLCSDAGGCSAVSGGGPLRNGTMLLVQCPAAPTGGGVCNLTLSLNPQLRLESFYGTSVSVMRGPLLFSAFVGNKFTKYPGCASTTNTSRGCGKAPFSGKNRTDAEALVLPPEAGWFGVEYETPPNIALVIRNASDLAASFTLSTPGLPCTVSPPTAKWPGCTLSTPPSCERVCAAPFNHTGFPVYLTAKAREVHSWTFVQPGFIEAAPPPESPVACAVVGTCGAPKDVMLVPHGATDVRVAALPWSVG